MSFRKSYYWDAHILGADLKRGVVSQSFKAKAFAVLMFFIYAGDFAGKLDPEATPKLLAAAESLSTFLILLAGIWVCYRINEKIDNRDFVGRYISLSLPLAIRLVLIQIALSIPVGLVWTPGDSPGSPTFAYVDASLSVLLEVIWFIWMRKYFLKMAAAEAPSVLPTTH